MIELSVSSKALSVMSLSATVTLRSTGGEAYIRCFYNVTARFYAVYSETTVIVGNNTFYK